MQYFSQILIIVMMSIIIDDNGMCINYKIMCSVLFGFKDITSTEHDSGVFGYSKTYMTYLWNRF